MKLSTCASVCIMSCMMLTTVLTTTSQAWSTLLLYMQATTIVGGMMAAVIIIAQTATPRLTAADTIMAAWWLYAMTRTYIGNGDAPACQQAIAYTTLAAAYAVVRLLATSPKPSQHTAMTMLMLAATAYELGLGLWQATMGTSHHRLYPATGSMFNPGPYSAYVAMGMTLAMGLLHNATDGDWRKPRRAPLLWLCAMVAVAGCFIIVLTRSRSAMIAVAMAAAWLLRKKMRRKYAVPVAIAATVAAAALFYMKMGSAMGRIVIWRQAVGMICSHPLTGTGLGSFAGEYGRQLASYFADRGNGQAFAQYADVADYAFCDLLQVFAEQGIIGGMLCMAFTAASLAGLCRHAPRLALPFATLMAFSLFSYPMQLLPLQTVAVCLAACGQEGNTGKPMRQWHAATLAALCAVAAGWSYSTAKPHVEAQAEYAPIKGMTHSMFIADYYRLYPLCNDDKHFLFSFAQLLQANNRHLDACAILRQGTTVSGDPMFHVLMGNSHRAMRQYDRAAACYERAFTTLPNRIYPLYKEMLLYKETGDTTKARQTARRLLEVRPKVESGATNEMRREANKMLTTH